ncbi:MAG: flagellar protein FlgN [Lachnospiraceae bacterium]|nr:flagellar protein FlgN [Lachnospiraceae bacterium]
MASLIETLIYTLERENTEYGVLYELSTAKTPVIIKGDLESLEKITMAEQEVVATIQKLEKDRMQTMKEISGIMGAKEELTLPQLIEKMGNRLKERDALAKVHDALKQTLSGMVKVNNQNRELLKNSLEMVEFEMSLLQTMKKAPETADYTRRAYAAGNTMGSGTKRFDSKQ